MQRGYARSYRTLRDGSFEGRFPRHFVPGYDRTVPPGHMGTATALNAETAAALTDLVRDVPAVPGLRCAPGWVE
jgi:hypothetical protein